MQASKIVIGKEYALRSRTKIGAIELIKVTKVITTRAGPHPSDFSHVVHYRGLGGGEYSTGPEHILGPYEEHKELVDAKAAEDAAKKAAAQAQMKAAAELVTLLYGISGQTQPAKEGYSDPFRSQYNRNVDINEAGVQLLLAALRERQPDLDRRVEAIKRGGITEGPAIVKRIEAVRVKLR